jgi:hypothetical protein
MLPPAPDPIGYVNAVSDAHGACAMGALTIAARAGRGHA